MGTSLRLIFIAFLGCLGGSSLMLTDSVRAQEIEGLEAAQNTQPAPTNMSPEEARNVSNIIRIQVIDPPLPQQQASNSN